MKPQFAPGELARFAAAAHRREAAVRAASPLVHQREFALVLEDWADNADRRAEIEEAAAARVITAPAQLELFGSAA